MMGSNASQRYKEQDIFTSTPAKLILQVYDYAILACRRNNGTEASRAVTLLLDGIDFEQGQVSVGLASLYQYIISLIKESKYDMAQDLLRQLRFAWSNALEPARAEVVADSKSASSKSFR